MKQPENNGIDTLLRGLARRDRAFDGTRAPADSRGAHLDADELSSYAEGALPASARARYTSHLADCDDCRGLVSQLSLAAGVIVNEERLERKAAGGLSWKEKLASLFSPIVWRFAMPALALIVLGFAFFAWQARHKESSEVAMNDQAQRASATKPGAVANGQGDTKASSGAAAKAPAKPKEEAERAGQQDKAGEADKKADSDKTASESKSASGSASQEEAKEKESQKTESAAAGQPADAPASAPAKAAPPAAERERQAQAAKDEEARDASQQRNEDEASNNTTSNNVQNARKGGPSQRRAETRAKTKADDDSRGGNVAGVFANRGRSGNDGETRSIVGRHFQRQNGLWVDTAFKSSQAVTNVARGSEQFRALIADEPEIATIARQLSGEVIVVWKGHAYRIR